jgi:2-polyprenyl-3-methyl-5-hydroxy-6-metoxy-1,4-benzoquinol methylase
MTTNIWYGKFEDAWKGYESFLTEIIVRSGAKEVLDVGGGANPVLPEDFIHRNGINCSILDISETELQKAPQRYNRIVADAASSQFSVNQRFDLVFSKMLLEHIRDAEQFHKNMLDLLKSKGLSVHFFPTLYTLPFFVNMLLPEKLAEILLYFFSPRDRHQHAKFPAYYRWCRGPTEAQIGKYRRLGYEVVEYAGFFGHGYYGKIVSLQKLHEIKTEYLLQKPNPLLTSYAYIVLKKA